MPNYADNPCRKCGSAFHESHDCVIPDEPTPHPVEPNQDKWLSLRQWIEHTKLYYRLNKHAGEWLNLVEEEMNKLDGKSHEDVCLVRLYVDGKMVICGKPRGHWRKE